MASNPTGSGAGPGRGTIKPAEIAHFGALAADWWDPEGSSAMLHRLNPVRLAYVRERADARWGLAPRDMRPLAQRRALDVGCGAGLLCEPLARLGASVTGIDATPENVTVARTHAEAAGLAIDYRAGGVEELDEPLFDLVTAMEVVEHVAERTLFLGSIARLLKPDGLLILSTPNRTPASRLAMITIGEGLNLLPRGTLDWDSFVTPTEMESMLAAAGLDVVDTAGIGLRPGRGLGRIRNTAINYLMAATPGNR